MGFAVGTALGTAVGFTDGPAEGPTVGTALGFAVGTALGFALGLAVGMVLGFAVGITVGTAVGFTVGALLGWNVGTMGHVFTFAENTPPLTRRRLLPGQRSGATTLPWNVEASFWFAVGYHAKLFTVYCASGIVAVNVFDRGVWPFAHSTFWNFTCAFFTTTLYNNRFNGRFRV